MVPAPDQECAKGCSPGKQRIQEDLEMGDPSWRPTPTGGGHAGPQTGRRGLLYSILTAGRVEVRGVVPVPCEERTSTRYFNAFSIWFCMNFNILA